MKKLIIILLITASAYSQDGISVAILQDVKLGLGLDDWHANDVPTLDLIANVNLEGNQFKYYYFAMQLQYEYANLSGGKYHRYGVNATWNFETIINNVYAGVGCGLHMINRPHNEGNGSYSLLCDLSYKLSDKLSVISKNEFVKRTDLPNKKFGYNLSFGLKYKI